MAISSSSRTKFAPGNVHLPTGTGGLPRDAAINVTQLLTVDKDLLSQRIGDLHPLKLRELEHGLRLALAL